MNNWKETTLGYLFIKIKGVFIIIGYSLFLFVFGITFYALFIYVLNNISNETAKNILEYIRVLVWPLVMLIFSFIFKENISKFIDGIKEGKAPGGFEFKVNHQLENQESEPPKEGGLNINSPQFETILLEKEKQIGALENNSTQLTDRLARAEIELDFEKIYNYIFASQIELLQRINNFENVSLEYAKEYFFNIRNTAPIFNQWDLIKYLSYLSTTGLILLDQTHFKITQKGKVFLMYLTVQNYKKYGI